MSNKVNKIFSILISLLMVLTFFNPIFAVDASEGTPKENNTEISEENKIEENNQEERPEEKTEETSEENKTEVIDESAGETPETTEEKASEENSEERGDETGEEQERDIEFFTYTDESKTEVTGLTEEGLNHFKDSDLVIPENVVKIGDNAFREMSFNSVTLPYTIEEIGNYSFYKSSINTLNGAETLKKIGDHALQGNNLTEILYLDNLETIGEYGLSDNKLENITFGNSLMEIGIAAFKDNNIATLELFSSENLKYIPESAFANNNIEGTLDLQYIENIGDSAFENNNITIVNLNDNAKSIGNNAFAYNNKFVKINTQSTLISSKKYESGYGHVLNPVIITIKFLDEKTKEEIINSKVIGDDLTDPNNVFFLNEESTYIPEPISGYKATEDIIRFNPNSAEFTLEVMYKNIKIKPVFNFDNLLKEYDSGTIFTDEMLLNGVTATDLEGNDITNNIVVDYSSVQSNVPGQYKVKYSVIDTFGNESVIDVPILIGINWSEYELGNGWTIGDFIYTKDAWDGELIPDGNMVVGFSDSGLEKLKTNKDLVVPHINLKGEPVTITGNGAFYDQGITSVVVPDSIEEIQYAAFTKSKFTEFTANGLKELSQGKMRYNTDYTSRNGKKIRSYAGAFKESSLETFTAPELTTISGNSTFSGSSLETFTAPNLTTISGSWTFSGSSLETFTAPNLTTISGNSTFSDSSLKTFTAPNLTTISGSWTFYQTTSLKTFTAPKLQEISGNETFRSAYNLKKDLYLPSLIKLEGIGTFDNISKFFIITTDTDYPTTMRENYVINPKSDDGVDLEINDEDILWENDDKSTGVMRGLTNLGWQKLDKNNFNLILPESVKDFASNTFYVNDKIESVTAPGLQKISGSKTFEGSSLKTFTAPELQEISGYYTFYRTKSLETFTAPKLTTISDYTFYKTTSLETFTAPELTTISGNSTFSETTSLETFTALKLQEISGNKTFSGSSLETFTAPNLTTISGNSTFYGAVNLETINTPELVEIKGRNNFRYYSNNEYKILPNLKYIIVSDDFKGITDYTFSTSAREREPKVIIYTTSRKLNNPGITLEGKYYIINPTQITINFLEENGDVIKEKEVIETSGDKTYLYKAPFIMGYKPREKEVTINLDEPEVSYDLIYEKWSAEYEGQIDQNTARMGFVHERTDNKIFYIGNEMKSVIKFDLSGFDSNITDGKIILYANPKYFNYDGITIPPSETVKEITKDKDKGIITLKLGNVFGGANLELPILWRFNKYVTPSTTPRKIDTVFFNGESIIAAVKPIYFEGYYSKPNFEKESTDSNSHGMIEPSLSEDRIGTTEDQTVSYIFRLNQLDRNIGKFVVRDTLPEYIASDDTVQRATFDEYLNPGWKLESDGITITYIGDADNSLKIAIPKITLGFPNAKIDTNFVNNASVELFPYNKPSTEKTMIVKDDVVNLFHVFTPTLPGGEEPIFYKKIWGPRYKDGIAFFYDSNEDRHKEFNWDLLIPLRKGQDTFYLKDYDLDDRMYYSSFNIPEELKNAVFSFYGEGDKLLFKKSFNSSGKHLLNNNQIKNVKYFEIKHNLNVKTTKYIHLDVYTRLKEPDLPHFDKTPLSERNIYKNFAEYISSGDNITTINYKSDDFLTIRLLDMKLKATKKSNIENDDTLFTGEPFYYTVGYSQVSDSFDETIRDFKLIDLIPSGINIISVELTDDFKTMDNYKYKIIENYNSSGQTAIIFEADSTKRPEMDVARINVEADPSITDGTFENNVYLDFSNNNIEKHNKIKQPIIQEDREFSVASVSNSVIKAKELVSRKYIRKVGDSYWSSTGIQTRPGEKFEYKLSVINNTDKEISDIEIIDVLPFKDDLAIQLNQDGERPSRGSEFSNKLDMDKNITVSRHHFTVGFENNPIEYLEGKTASEVLGYPHVTWTLSKREDSTAIRILGGPLAKLGPNESLDIIIPMVAPEDPNFELTGKRAYNTFVRKDSTTQDKFLEPNRVYNEIVQPVTILIKKLNEYGNKGLSGAEFSLYKKDGQFVKKVISDGQGTVSFDNIQIDDYILKETKAPSGYKRTNREWNISREDIKSSPNFVLDLGTVRNFKPWFPLEPITGNINIKKLDADNNPLRNIIFELRGVSDYNKDIVIKKSTGKDGKIEFVGVPAGKYNITEINPPRHLQPIVLENILVSKNNETIEVPDIINNKASIKIFKLGIIDDKKDIAIEELRTSDGETGIKGAEFNITVDGTEKSYTTGEKGYIEINDIPVNQVFKVEEKTAPDGYLLNTKPYFFKFNTKGELFVVDNEDGENPREIIFSNILIPNLKEKQKSILSIVKNSVSINKDNNETIKSPIEGAEFTLYKQNEETEEYEKYAVKTTEENTGAVQFKDLEYGRYKIVETKAPLNHINGNFEKEFIVEKYKSKTFSYEVDNKKLDIKVRKLSYIAKNVNKETAEGLLKENNALRKELQSTGEGNEVYNVFLPLQGVVFQLKNGENTVETITTDENGYAKITADIDENENYYLQEIKTQPGFKLLETPIYLNINDRKVRQDFNGIIELTVNNKAQKGLISVTKYKHKDGEVLSGVEFTLYDSNGDKVVSSITDENGIAYFRDIDLGKYTIKETKTVFGFSIKSKNGVEVDINEDNLIQSFVFYNDDMTVVNLPDTGGYGSLYGLIVILLLAIGAYWVDTKRRQLRTA